MAAPANSVACAEMSIAPQIWSVAKLSNRQGYGGGLRLSQQLLLEEINRVKLRNVFDDSWAGVEVYSPRQTRIVVHGGRRKKITASVFPGVIFLAVPSADHLDEIRYIDHRESRTVCQWISAKDQDRLAHEIESLKIVFAANAVADCYSWIKVGVRVEVIRGPYLGAQGIVEKIDRQRLWLPIETLGRAVSIEIDPQDIEAI
jgi:transcription antitermination factor NusG